MVLQEASVKHGQALKAGEAKVTHAEEARKLTVQAAKAAEVGSCLSKLTYNHRKAKPHLRICHLEMQMQKAASSAM